jgi:ribonucleoside-diphosphate reductase alpha chain
MNKHISIKKEELSAIKKVMKRDGVVTSFDLEKIASAVLKAFSVTGEGSEKQAELIAKRVFKDLLKLKRMSSEKTYIPSVELIQDLVEEELMYGDFSKTAKSYILYREEKTKKRAGLPAIPQETKELFLANSKYFASPYSEFIFYRTYAKWIPEKGRRETWEEAIDRFIDFMKENLGDKLSEKEYSEVRQGILTQEVCPSMRLLWSAGEACRQSNVWAYNCSYLAPTKWSDLGEIMYILMCGAGLGYSVETEAVQQFPQIKKQTGAKPKVHVVPDSKEGWADSFVLGLETWANGQEIEFDYSLVRPAGARLKTAGGRASGPQPLMDLMKFAKSKILARQGRRLSNLDMHDLICQIGLIVVAGGVRRSALISMSDLDDKELRDAKKGQFWVDNGQRSMANNSAVYTTKPSAKRFLEEWTALIASQSGERGIFNRGNLEQQVPARRWEQIKNSDLVGLNPCGEIVLQSKQFCNLTSIVVRPDDTLSTLKRKIKIATIIGTYQSSLTKFGYLSKEWKKNCDKEALLGVSITGYYDNEMIRRADVLDDLRKESIKVNKQYAKKIGVNPSTAITTIKPHGNSGQLLHVGSGMHPWFAPYYIRRVRISVNDPLCKFAIEQGVPAFPEVGYSTSNASTMVLEFPIKAPEGAVMKDEVSAIDLLKEWKLIKEHYVEHNPSVTIYVGEDEWIEVANFVYQNWEIMGGLSFLPRSEHVYQLAPYEEITKEEFEKKTAALGEIDFWKLLRYEQDDNTTGAKEFACVSGVCTVDDALAEESKKNQQANNKA